MALAPTIDTPETQVVYTFDGVDVDLAARRLRVDGVEQPCSYRVFNLLLVLCEEPNRVHTRDELIARLWPDGRFPSDESLSQMTFRLRAALGPYAGALVTLRRVGLRLDADVQRSGRFDDGSAPAASDDTQAADGTPAAGDGGSSASLADPASGEANIPAPRAFWQSSRMRIAAGIGALVVIVAAVVAILLPRERVVDAGWGLFEHDLMASRSDTAATVSEALAFDAAGNRNKARLLLETVHQADPSTPVPAMFLVMWSSVAGNTVLADDWSGQAKERLRGDVPHYTRLLARLMRREESSLRLESLLLDLRPTAWRLRLARAHSYLARNQRAEALADLKKLPVTSLDDRRLALVLGDRASLGDADGAEAALNALPPDPDNAAYPYARGRIHFARGDYAAARESFDQAVAVALRTERPSLRLMSELHAIIAQAELGEWPAASDRLRRFRATAWDEGHFDYAFEATLLLLAMPTLGPEERNRELEAGPALPQPGHCVAAELTLGVLQIDTPPSLQCRIEDLPEDYGTRGQRSLLRGYRAWMAGDPVRARDELEKARSEDVAETALAMFSDALAIKLGEKIALPPPPDPPYPYWSRFAIRWQLQKNAGKPLD